MRPCYRKRGNGVGDDPFTPFPRDQSASSAVSLINLCRPHRSGTTSSCFPLGMLLGLGPDYHPRITKDPSRITKDPPRITKDPPHITKAPPPLSVAVQVRVCAGVYGKLFLLVTILFLRQPASIYLDIILRDYCCPGPQTSQEPCACGSRDLV